MDFKCKRGPNSKVSYTVIDKKKIYYNLSAKRCEVNIYAILRKKQGDRGSIVITKSAAELKELEKKNELSSYACSNVGALNGKSLYNRHVGNWMDERIEDEGNVKYSTKRDRV